MRTILIITNLAFSFYLCGLANAEPTVTGPDCGKNSGGPQTGSGGNNEQGLSAITTSLNPAAIIGGGQGLSGVDGPAALLNPSTLLNGQGLGLGALPLLGPKSTGGNSGEDCDCGNGGASPNTNPGGPIIGNGNSGSSGVPATNPDGTVKGENPGPVNSGSSGSSNDVPRNPDGTINGLHPGPAVVKPNGGNQSDQSFETALVSLSATLQEIIQLVLRIRAELKLELILSIIAEILGKVKVSISTYQKSCNKMQSGDLQGFFLYLDAFIQISITAIFKFKDIYPIFSVQIDVCIEAIISIRLYLSFFLSLLASIGAKGVAGINGSISIIIDLGLKIISQLILSLYLAIEIFGKAALNGGGSLCKGTDAFGTIIVNIQAIIDIAIKLSGLLVVKITGYTSALGTLLGSCHKCVTTYCGATKNCFSSNDQYGILDLDGLLSSIISGIEAQLKLGISAEIKLCLSIIVQIILRIGGCYKYAASSILGSGSRYGLISAFLYVKIRYLLRITSECGCRQH